MDGLEEELDRVKALVDAAVTAYLAGERALFQQIVAEDPVVLAVAALTMLGGIFEELAEPGQEPAAAWADFLAWERAGAPPL